MDIHVMVADSASLHPDGTLSALRLGITELYVMKDDAAPLQVTCILQVAFQPAEAGEHEMKLSLRNEDGRAVGPKADAKFQTPEGNGRIFLPPLKLNGMLKRGRYEFDVVLDGQLRSTWPITVRDRPQPRPKDEVV